jgi:predicted small integral membrane protein
MKTQNAGNRAWAMVADFSEIAFLGLCTGLVFSAVAASMVVVVTTLN